MLFVIDTTSYRYDEEDAAPCEGATVYKFTDQAGNVRTKWVIEIADLEDLMRLKALGRVNLIIGHDYCTALPSIEIYDDYRE